MPELRTPESATVPLEATLAAPRQRRFKLGRLVLSIREHPSTWRQAAAIGIAVLVGLALSCITLMLAGVPADEIADEFIVQTFFDPDNFRAVLAQAAPLVLVGVGAALAFRVNFWNLGLGGQMIFGATFATAVSFYHIGPEATRLPLMLLAACLGGMMWMLIPALLNIRLQINEIISTLLMNYIAQYFLLYLVYGPWIDTKDNFPHSPPYLAAERLPDVLLGINGALPLAALVGIAAWWLVSRTRLGIYMRFVQANPRMAFATGVPLVATTLTAILISALCAGLAGFVVAAGQEGRLTQSVSNGYGVSGVLIAFMARNNPVAALLVAFLVAALFVTSQSLQVFHQIPFAMVQLIQAIIVICVAASEFAIRHRLRLIR
ncbi:ABC transporter permease [Beijerinckia sp. L45]|uniref:ABC transporter permease n=1 Tax=Beijerinckia sp. L45 TaxID=1641855 RepID=UPI00131DFE68|nr:ABC transporter permease [Beijerinckia sp. L45]